MGDGRQRARGDDQQDIQRQRVDGGRRQCVVHGVRRIERAAKDTDAARGLRIGLRRHTHACAFR